MTSSTERSRRAVPERSRRAVPERSRRAVPERSRRVVLATRNSHKVVELTAILGPTLGDLELVALPDDAPDPIEDAPTFAENALIKARSAVAFTGLPALADDSGIEVDALGGAPGVHSARYAGTRNDRDNVELLLKNLEGATDRTGRFVCAAAFVAPDGTELVEVATWPGVILEAPAGVGGFGYDPVFLPDGQEVSAAELTAAGKNAISHRTIAFRTLMSSVAARFGADV